MHFKFFVVPIILLVFFGKECSEKPLQKVQFQGAAQGTYYSVTYYDKDGRNLQTAIDSILKAFDQSVSVYQKNSIVSKVNRNEDVELDEWFMENFYLAQTISEQTNGSLDITIAPLANIWGFGTFEKPDSINPALVDSLKQLVNFRNVTISNKRLVKVNPLMQLNFNAVAQGFSVDVISEYLLSQGIENSLVDIGGEIYARGHKTNNEPWKVGIEIPEENNNDRSYNKIVSISDFAVATSGNYRKFYEIDGEKYAHTIDPSTGYPSKNQVLSVTVLAPTAGEADSYATAFMVMGVEKSLDFVKSHPQIKIYMVYDDSGMIKTAMCPQFEKYFE